MSRAPHKIYSVPNDKGWLLELKQCHLPKRLNKKRRPLLIIPGYGMNSFIFGYHPSGLSMESYLTRRGFEVWSANLRGQGSSRRIAGRPRFGLHELGVEDLKAVINFIEKNSQSETGKVDLIGCSLGGTIAFIYAALVKRPKAGSIVGIGSPLRWEKIHPILRFLFSSPRLASRIPVTGVRELIERFFPKIIKSPFAKLYLHPEIIDLKNPGILIQTIENPSRYINGEIAEWFRTKDLYLGEANLTDEFRKVKNPIMCVLANRDGLVPPLSALSPLEIAASEVKEAIVVGTDKLHFAHADLFISRYSHDRVFKPIADWLLEQYS